MGEGSPRDNRPAIAAVEALDRLLAKALFRAKSDSAEAAFPEINREKNPRSKLDILLAYVAKLESDCCNAIREYYPKYVQQAQTHQDDLGMTDLFDWAENKVWKVLGEECGIWPLDSPNHKKVPETLIWWLAAATQNEYGLSLSDVESWKPPTWFASDDRGEAILLTGISAGLFLRCLNNLLSEKDCARDRALVLGNGSVPAQHRGSGTSIVSGSSRKPKEKALFAKYSSPIKRAIALLLTSHPSASDIEICRMLDDQDAESLPATWQTGRNDRSFENAYRDSSIRPKIQTAISKVRGEMKQRGLLPNS